MGLKSGRLVPGYTRWLCRALPRRDAVEQEIEVG
jgi:hypothetical protein